VEDVSPNPNPNPEPSSLTLTLTIPSALPNGSPSRLLKTEQTPRVRAPSTVAKGTQSTDEGCAAGCDVLWEPGTPSIKALIRGYLSAFSGRLKVVALLLKRT